MSICSNPTPQAWKEKIAKIKEICEPAGKKGKKQKIAVLGGDSREIILIEALLDWGFDVAAFALSPLQLPAGTFFCETVVEALTGAKALILPMPGVKNDGIIYTKDRFDCSLLKEDLAILPPGTPVLVGCASSYLRQLTREAGLDLLALAETDEIAIPNAIPSALPIRVKKYCRFLPVSQKYCYLFSVLYYNFF
jgi:hypothetical protein